MAEQNAKPTPDVVSVSIPAEYVDDFRAALVHEIRFEAESIVEHAEKATPDEETILKRLDEPDPEISYADVRVDARLMSHDVAMFDQIEEATAHAARKLGVTPDYLHANRDLDKGGVALTVEGREALESLPHVFESMARSVVGPRLKQALGVGPIDRDWLPKIQEQIERASWAVERAAEYHEKALADLPRHLPNA